jgi:diguanylate cyclase (GGDEF)-like protein
MERPLGPSPAFRLLGLSQTSADVYPLLDWNLTVRVGGFLWLIGAVATSATLPFTTPTQLVGSAGWVIVGAIAVMGVLAGVYLVLRASAVSPTGLLLLGYAAAAGLGVGQALIGPQARFALPFLLVAAYQASVHPPRRVIPLFTFIVLADAASTLIAGPTGADVVQLVTGVVFLGLMTAMAFVHARSNRALARQLMGLHDEAEHRASTDSLTGLPNRRAFDEALARQVATSRRHDRRLSLVMLDLDDFKSINDRLGHETGDAVLSAVANAIRAEVRQPDVCFRWGRDEFAVLLPYARRAGAGRVARRITEAVHVAGIPGGQAQSIGSGVATLRADERTHQFVERADAELLATKHNRSPEAAGG